MAHNDPTHDDSKGQITVQDILKDAYTRRKQPKPFTQIDILDLEELRELQYRRRKEYEGYLKRNRLDMGQWIRYALFEIEQRDMRRARSVFERALLVNPAHVPLWIRYIDSELKLKYINHARNLLDRAIATLPRVDKLWYKYLFLEESLENWDVVRSLFTQWCALEPDEDAWNSYIQFEIRQENWENVRKVFARFVQVYPTAKVWLDWVYFETIHGSLENVRRVYSMAIDTLISYEDSMSDVQGYTGDIVSLVISFIDWETSQQEYERCRVLFKISLDKWPNSGVLREKLVQFEKKFGTSSSIENNIVQRRRTKYEETLKSNPYDYYTWMLYFDLLEDYFPNELVTGMEGAIIKGLPPQKKRKDNNWRRYIYIWIRFLLFVELKLGDMAKCESLYKRLINEIIPHKRFTFAKAWIMYSEFEIRRGDLTAARKILGVSLGLCPKPKLFKYYIDLETKLREFDRLRKIYERYIEFSPDKLQIWLDFARLEEDLGDEDRVRAIYRLALRADITKLSRGDQVSLMDSYIDFETNVQGYNNARLLYREYLKLCDYSVRSWILHAMYEYSTPTDEQLTELQAKLDAQGEAPGDQSGSDIDDDDDNNTNNSEKASEEEVEFEPTIENYERAKGIYEEALNYFKNAHENSNRALMFEAYQEFESKYGTEESQGLLSRRMPRSIRRKLFENGVEREILDYEFPDDESSIEARADDSNEVKPDISKFLAIAKQWKENSGK